MHSKHINRKYAELPLFVQIGIAIIIGTAISVQSEFGFLNFTASDISTLIVQISGAFLALSWPAAQMASNSIEQTSNLLSNVLKEEGEEADLDFFENKFKELKSVVEPGRQGVLIAFISFVLALLSMILPQNLILISSLQVNINDFICGLSFTFLLTAIINFLPTVIDAFKFSVLEEALEVIKNLKNQHSNRSTDQQINRPTDQLSNRLILVSCSIAILFSLYNVLKER